jgi:hypothetical protein
MTTLALLAAFILGACFGIFVTALLAAAKEGQRPVGAPRIHVTEETPVEHLRNSLQILQPFAFLNDAERASEGWEMIQAACKRIEKAIKQLTRKAA